MAMVSPQPQVSRNQAYIHRFPGTNQYCISPETFIRVSFVPGKQTEELAMKMHRMETTRTIGKAQAIELPGPQFKHL
jgi:hypothetical protein